MSRQKLPFGRRAFTPSRKNPIHEAASGAGQLSGPHGLETIRMAAHQAIHRRLRYRISLLLSKAFPFSS